MTISATEYPTAREAIQNKLASEVAIRLQGRNLVTTRAEAEQLECGRVTFAYLNILPWRVRVMIDLRLGR